MKYRVVSLDDGTYMLQYRTLLFFWSNSAIARTRDREFAIAVATQLNDPKTARIAKAAHILEVIYQ